MLELNLFLALYLSIYSLSYDSSAEIQLNYF